MRCISEYKTKRLDHLWKKIARSGLRLHGSARYAYVTSESGLGAGLCYHAPLAAATVA
jgi:hypothetical protein